MGRGRGPSIESTSTNVGGGSGVGRGRGPSIESTNTNVGGGRGVGRVRGLSIESTSTNVGGGRGGWVEGRGLVEGEVDHLKASVQMVVVGGVGRGRSPSI